MTKEEVLKDCKVEGKVVKLPEGQLDKKLYTEVKTALGKIGGKWVGGKTFGFVFEQDPTDLLSDIAGGKKRNLQKEFQFFGTPDKLADRLVALAELKNNDIILEPSAGRGAIVNAINRVLKNQEVYCYELMELNREFLSKIPKVILLGNDFLIEKKDTKVTFDKIIANPPFAKNQDIDHVYEMYNCLANGGRLVSIVSAHWKESKNKKETEFRNWLKEVGAEVQTVEMGSFKESGTMVGALILIIDKK